MTPPAWQPFHRPQPNPTFRPVGNNPRPLVPPSVIPAAAPPPGPDDSFVPAPLTDPPFLQTIRNSLPSGTNERAALQRLLQAQISLTIEQCIQLLVLTNDPINNNNLNTARLLSRGVNNNNKTNILSREILDLAEDISTPGRQESELTELIRQIGTGAQLPPRDLAKYFLLNGNIEAAILIHAANERLPTPQEQQILTNAMALINTEAALAQPAIQAQATANAQLRQQITRIEEILTSGQGHTLTNAQLLILANRASTNPELANILRRYVAHRQAPTSPALTASEQARFNGWLLFSNNESLQRFYALRVTGTGITPTGQESPNAPLDPALVITDANERGLHSAMVRRVLAEIRRLENQAQRSDTENAELQFLRQIHASYSLAHTNHRQRQIESLQRQIETATRSEPEMVRRIRELEGKSQRTNEENTELESLRQIEASTRTTRNQLQNLRRQYNTEYIDLITNPQEQARARLIEQSGLGPDFAYFILNTYTGRLGSIRTSTNTSLQTLTQRLTALEEQFRNGNNTAQQAQQLLTEFQTLQASIAQHIDNVSGAPLQISTLDRHRVRLDSTQLYNNRAFFEGLITNFRTTGYGAYLTPQNNPTNTALSQLFSDLRTHFGATDGEERTRRVFGLISTLSQLPPGVLQRLTGQRSINIPETIQAITSNNTSNNTQNRTAQFILEVINNPSSQWAQAASQRINTAIDQEIASNSPPINPNLLPLPASLITSLADRAIGTSSYRASLNNLRTRVSESAILLNFSNAANNSELSSLIRNPHHTELTPLVNRILEQSRRLEQSRTDEPNGEEGEARTRVIFAMISYLERLPSNVLRRAFGVNTVNVSEILNLIAPAPTETYPNPPPVRGRNHIADFILDVVDNDQCHTTTHNNNFWMNRIANRINLSVDLLITSARESSATYAPGVPGTTNDQIDPALIQTHDGGATQRLITHLNQLNTTITNLQNRASNLRGTSFSQILRSMGLTENTPITIQSVLQEVRTRFTNEQLRNIFANLAAYNALPPHLRHTVNPNFRTAHAVAQALGSQGNPLATLSTLATTTQNPPDISIETVTRQIINGRIQNSELSFLMGGNFRQRLQQLSTQENQRVTQLNQQVTNLLNTRRVGTETLADLIRRGVPRLNQILGSARTLTTQEQTEVNDLARRAAENPSLLTAFTPEALLFRARAALSFRSIATLPISNHIRQENTLLAEWHDLTSQLVQTQAQLVQAQQSANITSIALATQEITSLYHEGNNEEADERLLQLLRQNGPGLRYISPPLWTMLNRPGGALERLGLSHNELELTRNLFSENTQEAFNAALAFLRRIPTHNPSNNPLGSQVSLHTIDTNPSFLSGVQTMNQIAELSRTTNQLINAAIGGQGTDPNNPTIRTPAGTTYSSVITFAEDRANEIERLITNLHTNGHLANLQTNLNALRQLRNDNGGVGTNPLLDERIRNYEQVLNFFPNRDNQDTHNITRFLALLRNRNQFHANDWGSWWRNNGATLAGSIVVAAAAVALTIVTCGGAAPILVFAATLVAGAAGGIIGGDIGSALNHYYQRSSDPYYDGRPLSMRIGEEVYHPDNDTGLNGTTSTTTLGQVAAHYGIRFAQDLAIGLATVGLARGASGAINAGWARLAGSAAGRRSISSIAESIRRIEQIASPALRQECQGVVRSFMRVLTHELTSQSVATAAIEPMRVALEECGGHYAGYLALFLYCTASGIRRPNSRFLEAGNGFIRFDNNATTREGLVTFDPSHLNPNHPNYHNAQTFLTSLRNEGCFVRPGIENGNLLFWAPGSRPIRITPHIPTPPTPHTVPPPTPTTPPPNPHGTSTPTTPPVTPPPAGHPPTPALPSQRRGGVLTSTEVKSLFGVDPLTVNGRALGGNSGNNATEINLGQNGSWVRRTFRNDNIGREEAQNQLLMTRLMNEFFSDSFTAPNNAISYTSGNQIIVLTPFLSGMSPNAGAHSNMPTNQRTSLAALSLIFGLGDIGAPNVLFGSNRPALVDLQMVCRDVPTSHQVGRDVIRTEINNGLAPFVNRNGNNNPQPYLAEHARWVERFNDPIFVSRFTEILRSSGLDQRAIDQYMGTIRRNLGDFQANIQRYIDVANNNSPAPHTIAGNRIAPVNPHGTSTPATPHTPPPIAPRTPTGQSIPHNQLPEGITSTNAFKYANRIGTVLFEIDPSLPANYPAHAEVRINPNGTRVTIVRVRDQATLNNRQRIEHEIAHANSRIGIIDPLIYNSSGHVIGRMSEAEYLARRALEEFNVRARRGPDEPPGGPNVDHSRRIQEFIRKNDFEGARRYAETNGLKDYMAGFRLEYNRNVNRNRATDPLIQTGRQDLTHEELLNTNERQQFRELRELLGTRPTIQDIFGALKSTSNNGIQNALIETFRPRIAEFFVSEVRNFLNNTNNYLANENLTSLTRSAREAGLTQHLNEAFTSEFQNQASLLINMPYSQSNPLVVRLQSRAQQAGMGSAFTEALRLSGLTIRRRSGNNVLEPLVFNKDAALQHLRNLGYSVRRLPGATERNGHPTEVFEVSQNGRVVDYISYDTGNATGYIDPVTGILGHSGTTWKRMTSLGGNRYERANPAQIRGLTPYLVVVLTTNNS